MQKITNVINGSETEIEIELVTEEDYKKIRNKDTTLIDLKFRKILQRT